MTGLHKRESIACTFVVAVRDGVTKTRWARL